MSILSLCDDECTSLCVREDRVGGFREGIEAPRECPYWIEVFSLEGCSFGRLRFENRVSCKRVTQQLLDILTMTHN